MLDDGTDRARWLHIPDGGPDPSGARERGANAAACAAPAAGPRRPARPAAPRIGRAPPACRKRSRRCGRCRRVAARCRAGFRSADCRVSAPCPSIARRLPPALRFPTTRRGGRGPPPAPWVRPGILAARLPRAKPPHGGGDRRQRPRRAPCPQGRAGGRARHRAGGAEPGLPHLRPESPAGLIDAGAGAGHPPPHGAEFLTQAIFGRPTSIGAGGPGSGSYRSPVRPGRCARRAGGGGRRLPRGGAAGPPPSDPGVSDAAACVAPC